MDASKAMGCVLSGRLRPLADQGKPHKFDDLTADLLSAAQAQERALAALVTALIDSKLAKAEFVIGVIGECLVAHDSDPDRLRRVAEYVADGSFDRYALIKRLWAKAMPQPVEPAPTPNYKEDYMSAADPASDSQEAERQRAQEQQRIDSYVQSQLVPFDRGCAGCRQLFTIAHAPVVVTTERGDEVKFHADCYARWRAQMIERGKRTGAL
jgi:hypothetical protein